MDKDFDFKLDSDSAFFIDTIKHRQPYIENNPRKHDSISFQIKGNAKLVINGKEYLAKPDDIIYNARGNICEVYADDCEETSYIAVDFNFSETVKTPSLPFPVVLKPQNLVEFKKLFFEMRKQFFAEKPGYKTVCSGILLQIIGLLYAEISRSIADETAYAKIKPGVEYLNENFGDNKLSIYDAAQSCGISTVYFRKIFNSYFGVSPYEYINGLRITEAKRLLNFTNKTISQIAELCGFCDVYSFSHFFSKNVGTSPKKYKQF